MSQEYTIDEELAFNVSFSLPDELGRPDGFNKYGVKEYEDGSIDVIFAAMEPGLRKGIRITDEFLSSVSQNFSETLPLQLDHDKGQLSNVGHLKDVRFSNGFLRVLAHIPNTGNTVRSDVIADFTHEPPAINDGSVGFGNDYRIERNDAGEPEFVDATMVEFSLTPFPAGYGSDGGLSPQFAKAAREAGVFSEQLEAETPVSHLKGSCRARFTEI
ncbi:hypothetical protein [Natronorubrum bangense]|uniref:HK97 family phage prohead protease n=2 Tax=Natronorubrum bangense TaxID=61858 RepID=L9WKH4_9EURY|nr:hypothetical protein [Natronorubrum bangense]ELY49887.1 hypothetical protein C494_07750 [Natronorubrum bangense JCM 10635]QCC55506.1 hypothetical protein DV706_14125 [Natronorubrum bangense]